MFNDCEDPGVLDLVYGDPYVLAAEAEDEQDDDYDETDKEDDDD